MSHRIYQTEGFIIGSVPVKEASRYISIYTEELGLIRGVAQGVRNIKSKLKHSLQDLFYSKISLVRGKNVWRIVNSEKLSILENSIQQIERRDLIAKVASVLKRFVRGEGKDGELFKEIKSFFNFLDKTEIPTEEFKALEVLILLRMLNHLGYVSAGSFLPESTLLKGEINIEKVKIANLDKDNLSIIINEAINHSHL